MNNRMSLSKNKINSVFEITENIKSLLDKNIGYVFVRGEVSNLRTSDAGHSYFTLKDEKSQITAVLFKGYNIRADFKDGSRIIVGGLVSVYPPRGIYQIVVNQVFSDGIGELYKKYEELKKRLFDEGLFSEEIKKDIPYLPFHIGLITSPYGAAVRDFIRTAFNKNSFVKIAVYSSKVQGDDAAEEIISGIKYFNKEKNVDVIAIVRGGGSFEDLYCFNDENLAYTIRESRIPIVTGIGHEIDFTIADYVADLRAATPTAAAEAIVRSEDEIIQNIKDLRTRMDQGLQNYTFERRRVVERFLHAFYRDREKIDNKISDIENISIRLSVSIQSIFEDYSHRIQNCKILIERYSPLSRINQSKNRVFLLNIRMKGGILNRITDLTNVLNGNQLKLELLNPENILKKGYSLIYKDNGIVRSADELGEDDKIRIRFYDGDVGAVVRKEKV